MDDRTWFMIGVVGGAASILGAGYATYKIWIRWHLDRTG